MKARGMNAKERERKRKLDQEAKRDVMLMGIATMCIMGGLGALMVRKLFIADVRRALSLANTDSSRFSLPSTSALASIWRGSP